MNYRCCDRFKFWPMVNEGREKSKVTLPNFDRFYGSMRFPNQAIMELQWGYFGGISFLDAMMGRVLDVFDELDLWKNTIIVFTSDHGMHVGEKGMWEKYTLFEETTRVPLIIADPRYPEHHGTHNSRIVEVLDIIPTIIDLLNITRAPLLCPGSRLCPDFEGKSLAQAVRLGPLAEIEGIQFAISQLRRCPYLSSERPLSDHPDDKWNAICTRRNKEKGSVMGYSIRTEKWRYTAWFEFDNVEYKPDISKKVVSEELYSHIGETVADFDTEVINLIICELDQCVATSSETEAVRVELRGILLEFLAKDMNYNMRSAQQRTRKKYSVGI
jgi:iduronate 2-sulfatase